MREETTENTMVKLAALLRGRRFVALTGAGCSTESGIPDYRGPGTRHRAAQPMQAREFAHSPEVRARYWARSARGYPRIAEALPNPAHLALAQLEARGQLSAVITQNVDGLHQLAGSRRVLELHGAVSRVRCVGCGSRCQRDEVQRRLCADNPGLLQRALQRLQPDGDAEVVVPDDFNVPSCDSCGGVLRPDVVFFGEGVPREMVEEAYRTVDGADALLVVGSSLTVFSGFRFVRHAAQQGKPVAILNQGSTRGHALATVAVDGLAGQLLPSLLDSLTSVRHHSEPDVSSSRAR